MGGVATLQRAIDETLADMQQCKVFGQPLMAVQNTRFKLAEYQFLASVLRCFVDSRRTHAIVADPASIPQALAGQTGTHFVQ